MGIGLTADISRIDELTSKVAVLLKNNVSFHENIAENCEFFISGAHRTWEKWGNNSVRV